jgi:hypothetical protein
MVQVKQECPVLRRYSSVWPIHALVGIQGEEVRKCEQDFRRINGSTATLPDFYSSILEEADCASHTDFDLDRHGSLGAHGALR